MTRRPNAPEETIQQVAMLSAAGKSVRQIAAETSVPTSTAGRWLNRDEVRQLITEGRARIAARYVGLVDTYLDRVEAGEESLTGTPLLVQYGISQDKFDRAPQNPAEGINITINVDRRSVNLGPEKPT